jgi:ribosomal protein S18 acetylase RimI-like enzyme
MCTYYDAPESLAPFSDAVKIAFIADLVRFDDTAPMYWTRFLVLRRGPGLPPLGSSLIFNYPTIQFGRNPELFIRLCISHLGWSPEEAARASERWGILEPAFPDGIEWDGRWVVEGVYIAAEARGRGLVGRLLAAVLARARAADAGVGQAIVTCSVGNAPARAAYLRAGFASIGMPSGDARVKSALRIDGYEVLARPLPD